MYLKLLYFVAFMLPISYGNKLNVCMDGILHKKSPGPESDLFKQCTPWGDRSCCTSNTTRSLHQPRHHNFNLDHCKPISEKCRQHFIQDLCFYECSPNVGQWLVKVDMKIRNERFYKVPLCRKDCDDWFNDCKDDYTCLDNWLRGWNWTKAGNKCPTNSNCSTILETFGNAQNFCEKIWDDSWAIEDIKPCMKIWFNDTDKNPNDKVALYYSERNLAVHSRISLIFFVISAFLLYSSQ